jgi:hypothetical protein
VVGLGADGRHHDTGARRGAQLRQPTGEVRVPAGAQLDAVEACPASEVELGLEPVDNCSWHETFTTPSVVRPG